MEEKFKTYQDVTRERMLEIETVTTPQEFGRGIQHALDGGILEIEPRAIATLCAAVGVATQSGALNVLWDAMRRIVGRDSKTVLCPDGIPDELSFGFGWYAEEPRDAFTYSSRYRAKPYIVGGLIYRGPARDYEGNPYREHSWSIHT